MAVREKTRDELDLKTLRELASLPSNKYCFDCGQRGPTYVNVTIGAFVCSACGGILRGLNPPHRVKSLTVCSFTEVEMDRIKSRGNEYCTHIWLGTYDPKTGEADLSSHEKRKEFMRLKYEEKKFYVDPQEAIKKMKPRAPTAPASANTSVTQSKSHTVIQNKDKSSLQKSGALSQTFSAGDVLSNTSSDLFKGLEDPFKDFKQDSIDDCATDGALFADFNSAFGDSGSPAVSSSSSQSQTNQVVSSSSPSVQATTSASTITVNSHKKPAPPPPDRYAALADLDNQLHQQTAVEIPVTMPPVICSSTATQVFWSTPAIPAVGPVFAAVPPNPFGTNAWGQPSVCVPNPFQGTVVAAGLANPVLSSAKPSLTNGNASAVFWPSPSTQTWGSPAQNGQNDAFQSKAPVLDSCSPWPQSFATSGANPFLNGSVVSGQSPNPPQANVGKNPFL